jgi:3-(3-hydroxy-phenyl)propionate hydroxylase
MLQRWQAAGGKVWQWCHRSQAEHLAPAARRLESLDEALLPRRVPLGWVAIVRPDRCVLAEGPVSRCAAVLQLALERIAPTVASTRPNARRTRHAA